RLRLRSQRAGALRTAEGVDADSCRARDPAQGGVERGFDPRLANYVAGRLRTLADIAQQLRSKGAVRIAADIASLKRQAREVAGPLLQIRHDRNRRLGAHDDGIEHVTRLPALEDQLRHLPDVHTRDVCELAEL